MDSRRKYMERWDSRRSKSFTERMVVMTEKEVREIVLLLEISKVSKRLAKNLIRFYLNQPRRPKKKKMENV